MAFNAARAKSLFLAASELADPTERAAYLDRECGGDAELRARVEALLRANDAAPLPGGALPRDFLVDSGKIYALASTRPAPDKARVHVFVSADLDKWDEVLRFDAETFARSFELLGPDFYLGLGCDPEMLKPATGTILKVPSAAFRPPA